jgi:hypothetical protein
MEIKIVDAGDVAKQRFLKHLDEKIGKEDDLVRWEYFTYLLEQTKCHKLDNSGYACLAYQKDREEAKTIRRQREKEYEDGEFRLPERRRGRHF